MYGAEPPVTVQVAVPSQEDAVEAAWMVKFAVKLLQGFPDPEPIVNVDVC